MGFRTVVIKSRAKLEYQLNHLIVRGEDEKRVCLNEINTLIIETTAVTITAVLLIELVKKGIKVIFCDEKYQPSFECLPYYGSFENNKRILQQINWDSITKGEVWRQIVIRKIEGQREVLIKYRKHDAADLLKQYIGEVLHYDETNREGHAAKVYFNALFGSNFSRGNKEHPINIALNYGYTILLSAFNRNIVNSGYITQLGIWHDNEFNDFNFGSDLMEPFRPLVDAIVLNVDDLHEFKKVLNNLLNYKVKMDGKVTILNHAITTYVRSIFNALNNTNINEIKFMEDYEL